MSSKHFLTPIQLESLSSPARIAIVQRFEMDGQATARDLALRMGRSVTSLYYHLSALVDVGVLRVVGERRGVRRPEVVYALAGDVLSSAEAVKTVAGRRSYGRSAARVAEAGVRAFAAAVEDPRTSFEGDRRNALVRFFALRADAQHLARLNALLDEIGDAAMQGSQEGEPLQLTILMAPLPDRD
jgi:DNA-binding transcriptional ArsR family regulator